MDRFDELARSCCKLALDALALFVIKFSLNHGNMTKRACRTDPGLGWDAPGCVEGVYVGRPAPGGGDPAPHHTPLPLPLPSPSP